MRIIVIGILLSFMVVACSDELAKVDEPLILQSSARLDKSELFGHVELIPFDTIGGGQIGGIKKVIVRGNKIYALDYLRNRVVIHDLQGKFLAAVENKGDGPHTINHIADFALVDNSEYDILLFSPKGPVVSYALDSDVYQRLFTLAESVPSISYADLLTEDILVFYAEFSEYRLYYYSLRKQKIIARHLPNEHRESVNIVHLSPFYRFKDQLKLIDYYEGKLYAVHSEGIVLEQEFYSDKDTPLSISIFPKEIDTPAEATEYTNKNEVSFPLVNLLEDDAHFFAVTMEGGDEFQVYSCDKATRTCQNVGGRFNLPFIPFMYSERDRFYGVVNSREHARELFPDSVKEADTTDSSSFDEENPVLFIYQPFR